MIKNRPYQWHSWRESISKGFDLGFKLAGLLALLWLFPVWAYGADVPPEAFEACLLGGGVAFAIFVPFWRYVIPWYRWQVWTLMPDWILDEWGVKKTYYRMHPKLEVPNDE